MEPGITWYEVTGVRRRGGGLTPTGAFGSGSWVGFERWDEAVLTLKDARRTGAVKVLLEP